MNKKLATAALALSLFAASKPAQAQLSTGITDLTRITDIASSDFNYIMSGYLKPFGNAFCANLSSGWYNTAKVHKTLGFDIKLNFTATMIPSSAKTFDVSNLGNSAGVPFLGGNAKLQTVVGAGDAQTIGGKANAGPTITYNTIIGGQTKELTHFSTPQGLGLPLLPLPTAQIAVGIIKKTEIIVRFIPTYDFTQINKKLDFKIGMWGVGVKHDIGQWIPFFSKIPMVNLSGVLGYTQFKTTSNMSITPASYGGLIPTSDANYNSTKYKGQVMEMKFTGMTADVVASLDLPILLSIYGGLGVSPSKATFKLKGTFPIPTATLNGTTVVYTAQEKVDPVDLRIDDSGLKPHAVIGAKFRMGPLHFGISASRAVYVMYNANLSLDIR
jgi:hypothetical protein